MDWENLEFSRELTSMQSTRLGRESGATRANCLAKALCNFLTAVFPPPLGTSSRAGQGVRLVSEVHIRKQRIYEKAKQQKRRKLLALGK